MPTLTATRLIELLAQIIEQKGNVAVTMPLHGDSHEDVGVSRCWWNDERKCIVIDYR